jgi:AbrB family looped-hinge helix DNA binding protein
MATATMTSKGQITIPKVIREQLELKPGDRIQFIVNTSGAVVFLPSKQPMSQLKGIVQKPDQPVSLDDMEDTIQQRRSAL